MSTLFSPIFTKWSTQTEILQLPSTFPFPSLLRLIPPPIGDRGGDAPSSQESVRDRVSLVGAVHTAMTRNFACPHFRFGVPVTPGTVWSTTTRIGPRLEVSPHVGRGTQVPSGPRTHVSRPRDNPTFLCLRDTVVENVPLVSGAVRSPGLSSPRSSTSHSRPPESPRSSEVLRGLESGVLALPSLIPLGLSPTHPRAESLSFVPLCRRRGHKFSRPRTGRVGGLGGPGPET